MAVTSIWRVKGWLGKLVVYVENPNKTENPKYYEKHDMNDKQTQGLSDVIGYAIQTKKTTIKTDDEATDIQKNLVTGINCLPDTARDEMAAVKKLFSKDGGTVAYHGYQSFAPGEADPQTAHKIGVLLAQKLWGERHQVVVATHLDKENHLHNHFVVNPVSFIDGIRYYRSEKDYYNMQIESDKLCRENNLSVIPNPKRGKSKHYGEWKAEKDGKPTYRSMVKADIDKAVAQAMTMSQFWDNLKSQGYTWRGKQDISLCGAGKDRGLKMVKNFGEDYSVENIKKRILSHNRPQSPAVRQQAQARPFRFHGSLKSSRRRTGFNALYIQYAFFMGMYPKRKEPSPKQVYFLFREDIRKMRNYAKEVRLLCKYRIDTSEQLSSYRESAETEMTKLYNERKHLRYKSRSIKDSETLAAVKSEISALTQKIGKLRKEVFLCDDIALHTSEMKAKIKRYSEDQNAKQSIGKEKKTYEPFRGRR